LKKSLRLGSANRADAFASAAIQTSVCIDLELAVFVSVDSAYGALALTCATAQTYVLINRKSHFQYLQCIIVTILYHKDFHFARGKPIFSTDFYGNVYRSASLKARMVASRVV
jgi:hypothetical protein